VQPVARTRASGSLGSHLIRRAGLAALLVVAAVVVWILVGKDDDAERTRAAGVSLSQLTAVAGTVPHPVYWAGPARGNRYELTKTPDGRIYIRYLSSGAEVGNSRPQYRTIGTYPQKNAFATLRAAAKAQGVPQVKLAKGGRAFQDKNRPTSVYVAYPGSDYQIEVFDRSPSQALALVRSGQVAAVPVPGARLATTRQLKVVASEVGHPIWWAGPVAKRRYELTQTKNGRIYVRYLPAGIAPGDRRADYVSVGTYPQENALATLRAAAARNRSTPFSVGGGGLAYVDQQRPTSAYVAYPGRNFQIEVFTPAAKQTLELVKSGEVKPLR
jgi:hypothetical protein